jgi:hypothetical protein
MLFSHVAHYDGLMPRRCYLSENEATSPAGDSGRGSEAGSIPLKAERGAWLPWQKRNFRPLPHGQG